MKVILVGLLFLLKFQLSLSFVFALSWLYQEKIPTFITNFQLITTSYMLLYAKKRRFLSYLYNTSKSMTIMQNCALDPQFSAYLIDIAYLRFANYRLISLLNLQMNSYKKKNKSPNFSSGSTNLSTTKNMNS